MTAQQFYIDGDTTIARMLDSRPDTHDVLRRHGVCPCAAHAVGSQTVAAFAEAHGLDATRFMQDLNTAHEPMPRRDACCSLHDHESDGMWRDRIHHPYFLAGIAVVLTAGATWGVWLLWKIAMTGSFTAVPVHEINAHGHAQIFGWMTLFIMGFAYQAFPRMWNTNLVAPHFAIAAFALMLLGLIVKTAALYTTSAWSGAAPLALLGGFMEITAVSIFALQLAVTYRQSLSPFVPFVGFVFLAIAWLVLATIYSTWHTWQLMTPGSSDELLWQVATYQASLRDAQLHGVGLIMILGVSLHIMPGLFGLPKVHQRRALTGLFVLAIAVAGEVSLLIAMQWTHARSIAGLLYVMWILLALGAWLVASPWGLWRPMPEPERSNKFIRAAYLWLAVSLVMLLAFPLYQVISGTPFSHAYYGAIRHAFTVGFISLMIMGVAGRVVPSINGINTNHLTALWGPFVLVNVGCALRVVLQTGTDWHNAFFGFVGFSGLLEVTGIAWWAVGLVVIMCREQFRWLTPRTAPRPTLGL